MTPTYPDRNSSYLISEGETSWKMLFEILPVLVYEMAGSGLTDLPVEMIATILRYLDADSLLNAAKAYKACKDVCLGDPILHRRLKALLTERKRSEMERVMNPASGITITRSEPGKMFGKNATKDTEVRVFSRAGDLEDISKDYSDRKRKRNKKDVKVEVVKRCNYRL